MSRPDYLIVGPNPRRTDILNPGGQLTATLGLLQYARATGIELAFIDTLQGSFPVPPFAVRIGRAVRRLVQMLYYTTVRRPRKGVILFSAGPASFVERAASGIVARFFGVRVVICLRSGHLTPYLGASSPLGKVLSWLIRIQLRVVVQGRNWLPVLGRAGVDESRVVVVPNWIGPEKPRVERARHAPLDRPIRFIFVGWLVEAKGLRELIAACERLSARGQSFHVTIVGGGTLLHELQERVVASGLEDRVSMLGWISSEKVTDYVDQADVFVLPTHCEGFPNALIEAFALGLPAISTPVGAIPDSLVDGENGFLVAPHDAEQLALAMQHYINRPELVALHSARAIETIRTNHDFRTNCARLFNAVES